MKFEKQISLEDFPKENQEKIKEMICPLCSGIYSEPIIDNCSHVFCKKCLNTYMNENKKKDCICPVGTYILEPEKFKVFDIVEDLINNQDCYCRNRKNGCLWIDKFSKRKNHILKECLYEIINCKNENCNIKIQRKDQNEHDKICDYFLIECNKCHIKIAKINFKNHSNDCLKEEIECKCGKKLLRENMDYHLKNECELEEIKCDFFIYGCKEVFRRSDKKLHDEKMIFEHNKKMINWFLEKKKKMDDDIIKKEKEMEEKKKKINLIYNNIMNLYNELNLE